ncbi:MAG: hypothetical protein AAGF47_12655 [Planctomycetota bacterium]
MTESHVNEDQPTRLPVAIRLVLLAVAGLTAALSTFGVVVGLFPGLFGITEPMWILAGFEGVILIAAIFSGLAGLGWFRDGQPITLGCCAATIAICAVLGSLSLNNTVGDVSLAPFLAARLIAATLIGLAVLPLTLTTASQWLKLAIGAIVLSPVAVLSAPIVLTRIGMQVPDLLGGVTAALDRAGPAVALFATLLGGLLGIVAISVGGHLIITAFDRAAPATKPDGPESE